MLMNENTQFKGRFYLSGLYNELDTSKKLTLSVFFDLMVDH